MVLSRGPLPLRVREGRPRPEIQLPQDGSGASASIAPEGGAADLPGCGRVLLSRGGAAAGPGPAGAVQGRDAGELRARGLAGTPCP